MANHKGGSESRWDQIADPEPQAERAECAACAGTGMFVDGGTEGFCPYCDSTGVVPLSQTTDDPVSPAPDA